MIGVNSEVWSKGIRSTRRGLVHSDWGWGLRRQRNGFFVKGAFDHELEGWHRFQQAKCGRDITKLFSIFSDGELHWCHLGSEIQSPCTQALTSGVCEWMNQPIKVFLSQPPALSPQVVKYVELAFLLRSLNGYYPWRGTGVCVCEHLKTATLVCIKSTT